MSCTAIPCTSSWIAPSTRPRLGLLERLAGLHDVTARGQVFAPAPPAEPGPSPALLAALEDAGITVASVTVARPSLDDVYLQHAGRRFEVAA